MKTKTSFHDAAQIAGDLLLKIADCIERVTIAGSMLRRCQTVGDIEFVCIPKSLTDLFGDAVSGETKLDRKILGMNQHEEICNLSKNGSRQKQFEYSGQQIELYITTPERWAVNLAIRTGPKGFSKRLVTPRLKGGLLKYWCHIKDCRLWQEGEPVELESEEDFFNRFILGGYVNPHERK